MRFRFKPSLVGEKRCVTTLITAAEETTIPTVKLPMGNHYGYSETAHGKSLWIHQKEQKNYP